MQHAFSAASMASERNLSPVKESPRRALQNLSPNPKSTPWKGVDIVSKLTQKASPLKPFRTTTTIAIPSTKEFQEPESNSNSRKRSYDNVAASEEGLQTQERSSKEARIDQHNHESQSTTLVMPPVCLTTTSHDDSFY
jgi:hypothetical protein